MFLFFFKKFVMDFYNDMCQQFFVRCKNLMTDLQMVFYFVLNDFFWSNLERRPVSIASRKKTTRYY